MEKFAKLKQKHLEMEHRVNSPSFSAVCRFLEQWTPEQAFQCQQDDVAMYKSGGVFRIQGSMLDVHEEPEILRWWDAEGDALWWGRSKDSTGVGECLVTGELQPIALLHEPSIGGVLGAKATAKLVSYNCKSFESYGKEQSENAPVSENAAFAYCNALNYLLEDKAHHLRIGETTVVFWTDAPEEPDEIALLMQACFDSTTLAEAENNELRDRVGKNLEALSKGLPLIHSENLRVAETRFFILGLSPNAARLSVRFYHESTLGEFLDNLGKHFEGLRIQKRHEKFKDPDIISPYRILTSSVREAKDIPPLYAGALMRSILFGIPYPDTVAMSILRRFKADGDINYIRCAYLKAWLNRLNPIHPITTMLDPTNTTPGYLLGRLFAALTKTQEEALPGINRNIREAYYASASATPSSVFPRLLRLYTHHIAKLEGGRKIIRERLLQEIMSQLGCAFPARLNLREQGAFALGFYQQTQDFYTKSENKAPTTAKQSELPL